MSVFCALLISYPALGTTPAWHAEVVGRTSPKFDSQTGLPVIGPDGRQEINLLPGFRPSIIRDESAVRFLRSRFSLESDPPEYDPDTGLPILGEYYELEYVSLDSANLWTFSTPISPLAEDLRATFLIPAGDDGFATHYLHDDTLVIETFGGPDPGPIEIPTTSGHVETAIDADGTVHFLRTEESGLWYDSHRNNAQAPVHLTETGGDPFRIKTDADTVHLLYMRRTEDTDTNEAAHELLYRQFRADTFLPEEKLLVGAAAVEHVDLILDSNGIPHIGYIDPETSAVKIAMRNNGDWVHRTASSSPSDAGPLALAFNSGHELHVALVANGGKELWYGPASDDDFEVVSISEHSGFHFGVALAFRGGDTPVLISAESDTLFLKAYSRIPLEPLFDPGRETPQMIRGNRLQWYAGDGSYIFSRVEYSPAFSGWLTLDTAPKKTLYDNSGRRMHETPIDTDAGTMFFRAVYRQLE